MSREINKENQTSNKTETQDKIETKQTMASRAVRAAAASSRTVRGASSKKRTTRGAAIAQRSQDSTMKESDIETPHQAQLILKKYCPVYIVRSNGSETTCTFCRNQLDEVCIDCQAAKITDTTCCRIIECKCGHKFHKHCIDKWLLKSPYCPAASCGLRWENA